MCAAVHTTLVACCFAKASTTCPRAPQSAAQDVLDRVTVPVYKVLGGLELNKERRNFSKAVPYRLKCSPAQDPPF
eukprot:6136199-Amphidinium_carterae.1